MEISGNQWRDEPVTNLYTRARVRSSTLSITSHSQLACTAASACTNATRRSSSMHARPTGAPDHVDCSSLAESKTK